LKVILMVGGLGSRLSPKKPLLEVCGKPMALRVAEAAEGFGQLILAAVKGRPGETLPGLKIYTSGEGYEADVVEAVTKVGAPALVLPCDVPFLRRDHLDILVKCCDKDLCNLLSRGKFIGVSLWRAENPRNYKDVESGEEILNVNNEDDLRKAREMCSTSSSPSSWGSSETS